MCRYTENEVTKNRSDFGKRDVDIFKNKITIKWYFYL